MVYAIGDRVSAGLIAYSETRPGHGADTSESGAFVYRRCRLMAQELPLDPAAAEQFARTRRAILEDRFDGLMHCRRNIVEAGESLQAVGDPSGLQLKLDRLLWRLIEGTARRSDDHADQYGGLVDELQRTIRERIIAALLAEGLGEYDAAVIDALASEPGPSRWPVA